MHLRGALLLAVAASACASARPSRAPAPPAAPLASRAAEPESGRARRVRDLLPQNVRVVVVDQGSPARSASGVVVGNRHTPQGALTYVLTNAHVAAGRPGESPSFVVLVDLPTGDTQEFAAELLALGSVPDEDLAVLSVLGIALEPARLARDEDIRVGDEVVVVASPYGRELSVSAGIVSQVSFETKPPRHATLLKTDAAIGYGASGGGVFSRDSGRLLGIVEGYLTAKVSIPVAKETYSFDVPMPGETFASPAGKVRRFLERHGLAALVAEQTGTASAQR